MRALLFIISFLFSTIVLADGLPLDSNGNITVPHTIISINETQQNFLNNHRLIELTAEQKKQLGSEWALDTIEVLDPHHHDCTCARIYAIWINPKQIAILNRFISQERNEDFFQMCKENVLFYETEKKNLLYVGINGKLNYNGNSINLEETKTIINNKELGFLLIFLPPKNGNSNWMKILELKKQIQKIHKSELELHWM